MAKNERVRIYNKGGRTWPLPVGFDKNKKQVLNDCGPGKSIELDKSVADRMVKNYPDEFIHGEKLAPAVSGDIKKLKAENKALKAENTKVVAQFNEMTARIAELEAEIEDLNDSGGE